MGDDRGEGAQSGGAHTSMDGMAGEDARPSSAPAPVDGSGLASERGQELDESNRENSARSTSIPEGASPQQQLGSSPSLANGAGDAAAEATDMEALRAENALLRLALKEAEEKLRLANSNGGGNGGSPRSVRPTRREPGNRGVAYARMRRLLLKDDGFLHHTFLPFLDMDDLARWVGGSAASQWPRALSAFAVVASVESSNFLSVSWCARVSSSLSIACWYQH